MLPSNGSRQIFLPGLCQKYQWWIQFYYFINGRITLNTIERKQDFPFGCDWTWKMNYDCHIRVQDFSNYQSSSTSFHHPFHHPFSLPYLSMYVKGKMKLYTTSVHSAMVISNSASLQISPRQWSSNLMLIPHKRILKTMYIHSTLFITFKILISI